MAVEDLMWVVIGIETIGWPLGEARKLQGERISVAELAEKEPSPNSKIGYLSVLNKEKKRDDK